MSQSLNCWHCGHQDCMVDVADPHPYLKCSLCGATAVDPGTVRAPVCTERTDPKTKDHILTPRVTRRMKAVKTKNTLTVKDLT